MSSKPFSAATTRRTFLAGSAALAAATPLRHASAADALTLRLDWVTHGTHAPFFLAQKKGWFKDVGLDVNIEDGNGSATTAQLVGAGNFDLGHCALAPMALATAKGLDVISVAGFIQRGDTGFLVPKDSGWTKPSDLVGKTWDYTAGSLEGPFMLPFLKLNKIDPDSVTLLNVAATAKLPVYVQGKADTMVSVVPMNIPLLKDSRPSTGILFADFGLNLPGFGLAANKTSLAKKGDAIKRFASVACAAWTYYYNGHEQEACEAVLEYRPNSPSSVQMMLAENELYKPYFHTENTKGLPIGVQSAKDWEGTLAGMANAGTIPAGLKPEQFFTNDYIDQAIVKKIAGIG